MSSFLKLVSNLRVWNKITVYTSPCLRGDCACDTRSLINVASVLGYDFLGVRASEMDG